MAARLTWGLDASLGGSGAVSLSGGTTLGLTTGGSFAHSLLLAGAATVTTGAGQAVTWSGLVGNGASTGTLALAGGGTFTLTNAGQFVRRRHGGDRRHDAAGGRGRRAGRRRRQPDAGRCDEHCDAGDRDGGEFPLVTGDHAGRAGRDN